MKKIILFIVISIISFEGLSFSLPKGHLIYTVGTDAIYDLNLKTGIKSELHKEYHQFIIALSKFDESEFIFTSIFFGNSKTTYSTYKFNRKNHVLKKLKIEGRSPKYIKIARKFLFYNTTSFEEGHKLYVCNLDGSDVKEVSKSCSGGVCDRIIQVSPEEVIFLDPQSKKDGWILYNVIKEKLRKLSIHECFGIEFWPGKTRQMMCYDKKRKQNFFTDLEGKNRKYISAHFKGATMPFLYLYDTDQLLFTKGYTDFTGEHYDLWVYDFETNEKKRLFKHIGHILPWQAVYYPN